MSYNNVNAEAWWRSHKPLTGMEAGLLTTTMSSSMCTTVIGWQVTGTSCLQSNGQLTKTQVLGHSTYSRGTAPLWHPKKKLLQRDDKTSYVVRGCLFVMRELDEDLTGVFYKYQFHDNTYRDELPIFAYRCCEAVTA